MHIGTMQIVLLYQKIGRIYPVYPGRHICHRIILTFSRNSVQKYRTFDIIAVKQTDFFLCNRSDPVRCALLVNLKIHIIKDKGRILEPELSLQFAVKQF